MRARILGAVTVALGIAVAPQWVFARQPCAQVRDACLAAGFTQGGARQGTGLQVDCIRPILAGTAQPGKASRPLPQVDPRVVAACKAAKPDFGSERRQSLVAQDQLSPGSVPPPVATVPSAPPPAATSGKRPNVVFVLTDDLSWNLVQYMPRVVKMAKAGVTFVNYFVTDSLCCPSRSSIFTGRYPHNTGIFRNLGTDGGYIAFHNRGHEQATFANALSGAGYRLAMLGKYLNGYMPRAHPAAPGWALWAVAGNGYPEFNYDLNQNGRIARYGARSEDYLTDVASHLAVTFIKESAGTPFVIEVATFAPHAPYTPAPRDADALPGLRAPRTPAFDAAPEANAPQWLKAQRPLSDADMAEIDKDFRKRAQSVLAVDAMIGALQDAVAAIGEANNTYFIFSSDNGYHMGEHRLMPGKMTAFDTDIRVPLVVTGPGVPAGTTVQEIAENIDLCPTFTELGGMATATTIDGRSLVPLLRGEKLPDWRRVALIEHHGPVTGVTDPDLPGIRSGNPPSYEAMRGTTSVYVEYANGDKEYHDLAVDPDELHNSFSSLPSKRQEALHAAIAAIAGCHGAESCSAAARPDISLTQR